MHSTTMNNAITLVKESFSHWQQKRASRMGAAISFYAIFSIAPLFILLSGLVQIIFNRQTTQLVITRTLGLAVGNDLGRVIQTMINSAYHNNPGIITAIVSGAVLIIAALSVFSELNTDLNELWSLPAKRTPDETVLQSIKGYIKSKFISFGLILVFGLLLLISVAFTVLVSFFNGLLPDLLRDSTLLVQVLNIIMSLIGSTILFTLIYRILPNIELPWKELLWGALVTSVLFLIGRFLISWYISAYGSTSDYGAAGSIIGLLLWIYYSAQVFFIGASGTFVYSKLHGYLSKKN
jgi:membrane protein